MDIFGNRLGQIWEIVSDKFGKQIGTDLGDSFGQTWETAWDRFGRPLNFEKVLDRSGNIVVDVKTVYDKLWDTIRI